jgi:hypothetical protein
LDGIAIDVCRGLCDDDIAAIDDRVSLRFLSITNTLGEGEHNLTAKSLAAIGRMRDLECLVLDGLGQARMGHNSLLQKETVHIDPFGGICDSDLAKISHLTKLKVLSLREFKSVTGSGLSNLSFINLLEELNLSDTRVTTDGLSKLPIECSRLSYIGLRGTRVDDAVAAVLAKHRNLTELDVSDTENLSRTGVLRILQSCRSLRRAIVSSNVMPSKNEIEELRAEGMLVELAK